MHSPHDNTKNLDSYLFLGLAIINILTKYEVCNILIKRASIFIEIDTYIMHIYHKGHTADSKVICFGLF